MAVLLQPNRIKYNTVKQNDLKHFVIQVIVYYNRFVGFLKFSISTMY